MNIKKITNHILFISVGVIASINLPAQKMEVFPLNQVKLLPSPFLNAQNIDLAYMLKMDPDKLLAPFLREAGLAPKAESYGNWENSGLDGHTAGHYLTALAQMYAASGNQECKRRMIYMINELALCQTKNANGYVGGIPDGNRMWALAKKGDFSAYNQRWVPWYNIHKLFAGLRDCYLLTGNIQAKEVLLKLTDWADDEVAGLTSAQLQQMLANEHGGMNEVLADVAAISGNPKYLSLAEKFNHRSFLDPLTQHVDKLTGLHANTQIPKVIGMQRIAELKKNSNYSSGVHFFWENVVNKRSISIGGNSVREHFNPSNNFAPMLQSPEGPETCNSNNMLKLTKMLFIENPQEKYAQFYERLLYNHILSSQHPLKGGFVYFTPIHPQHYRTYSTPENSFWCCVGTGIENHSKYAEIIYTHKKNDLYINLFIPSSLDWKDKGVQIIQQNNFPEEQTSLVTLKMNKAQNFAIYVRKPKWVTSNGFTIKINGKPQTGIVSGDFVRIERTWKSNDKIDLSLPMKNSLEYLPDNSNWVSFLHGPIVLAAPTNNINMIGLMADDSRWGHIAHGQLYGLSKSPLLVGNSQDLIKAMKPLNGINFSISDLIVQPEFKNLKLVPFYKVHDTRYMLYWPTAKKDSIPQKIADLQVLDDHYLKFASRTIDQISPGEQQPESDHALVSKESITGYARNLHWRSATDFFSYRMRINKEVKSLGITYDGMEKSYDFEILIDDQVLTRLKSEETAAGALNTQEFVIPESMRKSNGRINLKLVAKPGSRTAAVFDLRLLK